MLSRHDAAIAGRDPALPGLGVLLDATAFASWLDAAAPGHGVRGAEPIYLRYKPGANCVAGFRVSVSSGETVDLYAKAYTDAHFEIVANRRERARFEALAQPRLIAHPYRFVVRHAACDRELPAMKRLANPKDRAGLLDKLLPHAGAQAGLETIRYKAERRFVGRVCLGDEPLAVVKAYTKSDFPQAIARARLADAAGLASLMGAAGSRRALALEWHKGTMIDRLEQGPFDVAVRKAGMALAGLHAGPRISLLERDRRSEFEAAQKAAVALSALSVEAGEQALAIVRRAADALEAFECSFVTIHGDFSADQVLVAGEDVTIIDWDRLGAGEASTDLASFAARLEADAATGMRAATGTQSAIEALLEGYQKAGAMLPPMLDLHMVLALVRLAPEPFRCRLPDWPDRIAAIVARAEALLDRHMRAGRYERRAG